MRRYLLLCLLPTLLPLFTGCGESPSRPSVVTDVPVNPPKTRARFIQSPWDISLFFNIPGGAIVTGATTAATSGGAAEGDNLTGTFVNSNGFAGTLTGVLTGNLENGTFNGSLSTITQNGCTAERRFSGPITTTALNWSPGAQVNDCGGASPLTSGIQAAAAPPTAPPPCTYAAAATGTSVPTAGGTGTVTVTAGEGCTWFATSSAGFVTLSATQGSANGSVQFTVAANTSTAQRTAIVVVAGQSFTITQAGVPAPVCNYRLNDSERTFDANGGTSGVDMRVAAGCAWQAQSDASWLTITGGASGSGDGTISYAVAANPGLTQRVGRITATGDQDFTVTQLGIVCRFTLTPNPASFLEAGGPGTLTIATQSVCAWSAVSNVPWITFSGTTSGTGNGTVTFNVVRNTAAARTGTITVATGQSATITQAGSPPSLTFTFIPNPAFQNPNDLHCGRADTFWCWRFASTIANSGETNLVVTQWEINLYDVAGARVQHTVFTSADFARFYNGATAVGARSTVNGGAIVWYGNQLGGTVEIVVQGVDVFNRSYRFVSNPRLTAASEPILTLQPAPDITSQTPPPPPRPLGGSAPIIRRQ